MTFSKTYFFCVFLSSYFYWISTPNKHANIYTHTNKLTKSVIILLKKINIYIFKMKQHRKEKEEEGKEGRRRGSTSPGGCG